jgi:hypothetical protein
MLASNGADPEAVYNRIISVLVKIWKSRPGFNTDTVSVMKAISKASKGQPLCCWIGDDKLKAYVVNAALNVEKRKADAPGDGN